MGMAEKKRRYTREMTEWAAGLTFGDIPARVVEQAKMQTMSVLAAIFAGSRMSSGGKTIAAALRGSDPGPARLIPSGERVTVKDALAAASSLSMALDYDDYTFAGHPGHSAALVPLMMAAREDISGEQILLAQTVANEIESRIGGSVMVGPLNGQMWSFIHAAGAACAAGKIYGLDSDRMASALGMALSQPASPLAPGFMGADSKLLTASAGISSGLLAAQLAAEGLKGPQDILEAEDGFCETLSFVPIYPMLTRLGSCWLSDTMSVKLYPGCAYISATMDGVFEIMRNKEINPDDIFKIDVHASIATVKMDEMSRPLVTHQNTHPVTLNFYTPYNVAAGVLDGKLGPEQFEPERVRDPKVWELARRVRVHHDMSLTSNLIDSATDLIDIRYLLSRMRAGSLGSMLKRLGPASPLLWLAGGREITGLMSEGRRALEKVFGAPGDDDAERRLAPSAENFRMAFGSRVVFDMKSKDAVYEFEQKIPFGAAGWPLEDRRSDACGKFEKEALATLTPEAATAALDAVSKLERLDNAGVRSLLDLCCSKK